MKRTWTSYSYFFQFFQRFLLQHGNIFRKRYAGWWMNFRTIKQHEKRKSRWRALERSQNLFSFESTANLCLNWCLFRRVGNEPIEHFHLRFDYLAFMAMERLFVRFVILLRGDKITSALQKNHHWSRIWKCFLATESTKRRQITMNEVGSIQAQSSAWVISFVHSFEAVPMRSCHMDFQKRFRARNSFILQFICTVGDKRTEEKQVSIARIFHL